MSKPRSLLDPACPVEWAHPLNRGLVHEWSIAPIAGWRGGVNLRDLVRGGRNANPASLSGSTWIGPGRPGGYGALHGGTATVTGGAFGSVAPSALTYSFWLYSDDSSSDYQAVSQSDGVSLTTFQVTVDNQTSGFNQFKVNGTTLSTNGFRETTGNWVWYAIANNGTTASLYRNGVLVTSGAASVTWNTSQTLQFIKNSQLRMDGFRVHSRALSAEQVQWFYAEDRRGNPERWHWVKPWSFGTTAAGGGAVSGSGTAAGQVLVTGAALRGVAASGTAAGLASVTGAANRIFPGFGTAAGHATLSGVGQSGMGSGTASGSASVTGAALRKVVASGNIAGLASVAGTANMRFPAAGSIAGHAAAVGVGSNNQGSGAIAGGASVTGTGLRAVAAFGTAAGHATVIGVGQDGAHPVVGPPSGLLLQGVGK